MASLSPARRRALRPLAWLLAMLLLPLTAVLAAAPAHAEAFVLTGEVVDAVGQPIEGVAVTARPVADQGVATSARTDEDGVYDLDLAAGSYRITYVVTGFATATYDDGATVVVDAAGTASVGGTALDDNELDPVFLDSEPLPVAGRVLDAGGTPVTGVTVRAYPSGSADPEDLVARTVTAGGAWQLRLPIGDYDLQLVDETEDGTTWAATWLGGATPVMVTVGQGGALAYDDEPVDVLPAGVVTVATGGPVAVSGEVVDVNDEPVAGIVVTATPGGTGTARTATTDAQGRYTLSLVPGGYTLSFEGGAEFADTTLSSVVVRPNGQVTVGGVEAVGGVLETVELTSTATYPLAGTATTAAGAPLADIRVRVFPEGDTDPESVLAQDVTDAAGRYDVRLGLGTYVLELSDTRSTPAYVTRMLGTGPDGSVVTVAAGGRVLVDEAEIAGHTLPAVALAAATDTTTYHLRGEVSDANYDALAGITVTAVATSAGDADATTTTDAEGLFDLAVTAGSYRIRYQAAGYPTTTLPDAVVVAPGGAMTLGGQPLVSGDLDVTLYGTATRPLGGTVVGPDDKPLAGISVTATPDDEEVGPPTAVTTTADGTFTLPLRVGAYTIRLVDSTEKHKATYYGGLTPAEVVVPTTGAITADDKPITDLGRIGMEKVGADDTFDLAGGVYDGEWVGLGGVTVEVLRAGTTNPPLHTGTTDSEGGYRIAVQPGVYHLRFSLAGRTTTYLLDEWDEKPARVTVSADGRISSPDLELEGDTLPDVDLLLPPATMVKAPSIRGSVAVGQTVEIDLGTWQGFDVTAVEPGEDWRDYVYVEWFLDGRSADQWSGGSFSQKFTVPAQAGGKVLSFRVTIEDDEDLRAPIVWTSGGTAVPKAPSSVKGSVKKGRLTITVTVPGLAKPTGKLTVLKGKKKVGKATLKAAGKGKAVVVLKLKPGKHTLTLVYAGTTSVAAATAKLKVKLPRR
ncbi:carboxypeptidase-like regulatory domain-containing protein [Nocardioides dongkuii]|uniref:carboxypeptidase-like regulatory domain-containing protein n=1 Tax=Nocardioides dongkuii TaxID=2760089 RepID=UPI001878C6EE|nr:carboxypeptidase-like regulatory domain-containing protein [Nocardioides dongkuii]